ncbi:hypothetical protein BAE44_0014386 [Dichanthelium oligosanthes]|uniref:Uncharacterized protein n=1 Tax=Dichanthelium oligosanthes TaxID=888268 RepID=A0A1E5VHL4_9POAL|nr:hypothetical protein BAE44_0014386 [Dichanthelium oligosanthes]
MNHPILCALKDCQGVHVIGSLLAVYDLHVLILIPLMIVLAFLQGRISCVVHVNPHNQTIVHQDCYPEVKNCKAYLP